MVQRLALADRSGSSLDSARDLDGTRPVGDGDLETRREPLGWGRPGPRFLWNRGPEEAESPNQIRDQPEF
jgi:hypothetical protein